MAGRKSEGTAETAASLAGYRRVDRLSLRLGLVAFTVVAATAAVLLWQSNHELASAYRQQWHAQAQAVAASFAADFRVTDLERPATLREQLDGITKLNPLIRAISVYRRQDGRGVRVTSTVRGPLGPVDANDTQPIVTGRPEYKEVREGGEHVGELNSPLEDRRSGERVAAIGLYLNLAPLDAALTTRTRHLTIMAVLVAALLAIVMLVSLSRSVLRPLDRLRLATRKITGGQLDARLGWKRPDTIGALARDLDEMAHEIQSSHDRLSDLALRDPLTGLLNHRASQERLEAKLARARREDCPVAIVALDIDYFKGINDRSGHAAGDEALRLVAQAIVSELRPADFCGRVGGDEFIVVLFGVDARQAAKVVARVRAAVAAIDVLSGDHHLAISAGIAEFPRHAANSTELLRMADEAMYWSKRGGRDRQCVYSTEGAAARAPQDDADAAHRESLGNPAHGLAAVVDAKDGYTYRHSTRVAVYAAALATRLGFDEERIAMLRTAGVLHDVGKIGVPDAILLKPGRLDAQEFAELKRHSQLGYEIIAGVGMPEAAVWVLHLHERFDGHGYPDGLAGHAIPLESRVLNAVDALEAMTSSRVYRAALTVEDALCELEVNAGTQFDPSVVAQLVELVREGELISHADSANDRPAQIRDGELVAENRPR